MDLSEVGESGGTLGGTDRQDHPGPHLTRVYFNPDLNRADWGPGPWDDEPDKVSWTDEETDLPCLLVRNQMGAWCGYVAVEPGHPLHGTDGYTVDLRCHGGITFSDFCQKRGPEEGRICHIPTPGRSGNVYWFGFDAAHAFDLVPSMVRLWGELGYTSREHLSYRSASYMRAECESLARQLKEAGG